MSARKARVRFTVSDALPAAEEIRSSAAAASEEIPHVANGVFQIVAYGFNTVRDGIHVVLQRIGEGAGCGVGSAGQSAQAAQSS